MPAFFILFSLSRCGSTSLHRALNAHAEIECMFEPDFSGAAWDEKRVLAQLTGIQRTASGMKHVWDPSGFPFVSAHRSNIAQMERYRAHVSRLNAVILSANSPRVIFLTRRDQVARAISDLLGQQTELWGPLTPDGRLDPGADEVSTYRAEVRRRRLEPIDPGVIEWYLQEVPALEEQLRAGIDDARCLDVTYESIFDERVLLPERARAYCALLDFLGYDSSPRHWDRATVEHVLAPTRRLNGPEITSLIPNASELRQRFGME